MEVQIIKYLCRPFVIDKTKGKGHFQDYEGLIPSSRFPCCPGQSISCPLFLCQNMLIVWKLLRHHQDLIRRPNHLLYMQQDHTELLLFFKHEEFCVSVDQGIRLLVVLTIWLQVWPCWRYHKPNPSLRCMWCVFISFHGLNMVNELQGFHLLQPPSESCYDDNRICSHELAPNITSSVSQWSFHRKATSHSAP